MNMSDPLSAINQQIYKPETNISCQDLLSTGSVSFHGFLRYKSEKGALIGRLNSLRNARWNSKYVVLHKGAVYVYEDESSLKAEKAFSLFGYTRVEPFEASNDMQACGVRWPFQLLGITGRDKLHMFAATAADNRQLWVRFFQQEMCIVHSLLHATGGAATMPVNRYSQHPDLIPSMSENRTIAENQEKVTTANRKPPPPPKEKPPMSPEGQKVYETITYGRGFTEDQYLKPRNQDEPSQNTETRMRPKPPTKPKGNIAISKNYEVVQPAPRQSLSSTNQKPPATNQTIPLATETEIASNKSGPTSPDDESVASRKAPLRVPVGAAANSNVNKMIKELTLKQDREPPTERAEHNYCNTNTGNKFTIPKLNPDISNRISSETEEDNGAETYQTYCREEVADSDSDDSFDYEPFNPNQGQNELETDELVKAAYCGESKQTAERLLRQTETPGAFMIRETADTSCYKTLMVCRGASSSKFKLFQDKNGYSISANKSFRSMRALLDFYCKHPLPTYPVKLTMPYSWLNQ